MLTGLAAFNDAGNVRNVGFEDLIEGGPKSFGVKNRLYLGIFEKVDRGLELLLDPIGGKDSVAVVACAESCDEIAGSLLDLSLICRRSRLRVCLIAAVTIDRHAKRGEALLEVAVDGGAGAWGGCRTHPKYPREELIATLAVVPVTLPLRELLQLFRAAQSWHVKRGACVDHRFGRGDDACLLELRLQIKRREGAEGRGIQPLTRSHDRWQVQVQPPLGAGQETAREPQALTQMKTAIAAHPSPTWSRRPRNRLGSRGRCWGGGAVGRPA